MKKLLALCLIALMPLYVFAQTSETGGDEDNHMITVQTNVVGSSFVWTNTVVNPWRLATVTFTLPASSTNTFGIDRVWFTRELGKGTIVTTNSQVESPWNVITNFYPTEVLTYHTNALIASYITTNVTDLTFQMGSDTGDLPTYLYLLGYDSLRFSFSITNDKPFIFTGIK